MDNTTAISYINKMWGTSPMLASLVFEIWQWCLQRTVSLSAEHIPGALSGIADTESRVDRDSSDWKLDPSVFACLNTLWGPLEVDLFATRLTNQLSRFVGWRPDLEGEATDAFTLDWSQIRGYVFSPSSLVGPCLSHLREQNSEMLCLVAPIWETQPWNPVLLHLSVDFPTFLPVGQEILSREGSPHPLPPPPTCRMACASQRYLPMGISSQAEDLLSVWRNQTSGSYESDWSLWHSWCDQQQIDPLSASVHDVVNYLASKFTGGKEFRTIYVTRSAISDSSEGRRHQCWPTSVSLLGYESYLPKEVTSS